MKNLKSIILLMSLIMFFWVQPAIAGGTITVGQTFLAGGSDPVKGSTGWALTSHGISQNLFTVNKKGTLIPLLAESVKRQDESTWLLNLKKRIHFSDGSIMTASDVASCLTRTNTENPISRSSAGKINFTPVNDTTVSISTERPVPNMAAVLAEWTHVVYKKTPEGLIFTGPFKIIELKSGDEIKLSPNPYFSGAEQRPDIRIKKFSDAQSLALAFEAGEIDLAFNLPVETLPRLKAKGLIVKSFPVAYQYFGFVHTEHPPLNDIRVRKAIDLAINRNMLTKSINAGKPATGAYASYFPFSPKEERKFNMNKAKTLLDQAGWKMGKDNMREKDGQKLIVKLVGYPQRPDLVTMQPVIKAMLADVGIGCETHVSSAVGKLAKAGEFDILLYAQNTAPSGDPGFFLNQTFRSNASNNYSKYSSPEFDAVLDQLSRTNSIAKRSALAIDAQKILFKDAPALFLVSPEWHVGLSKKLESYTPWGSDYYIIRPDLRIKP